MWNVVFNIIKSIFTGIMDDIFFICINVIHLMSSLRRLEKENNKILHTNYELLDFVFHLLKTVLF